MTCLETIQAYALRSMGIGERLLPQTDFTLCQQITLIGSGMLWNIYFGTIALVTGFLLANAVAVARNSHRRWLSWPADWFILIFRGSPLFIQFFFAYFAFLSLKSVHPAFDPFTSAWLGAALVLFLNTSAYSAMIFYGGLQSIPKGDLEAADAYGLSGFARWRRVVWPTTMRLAWPAYTNEAIFLFHATTLVFFSGFPAVRQRGDALYYASYFADKTFNPFVPYPILACYFILLTLCIIGVFGLVNRRLNRHLPGERRARLRLRPAQLIR
ncbi:ABC transporter permease [Pseudoroseicyclus sp. CXY001]|uniref:ABC transporter permease n=1 Tax=Pseudoroseicyclus sp. CXY001 TaxID=3242492 RepID=UPI0035717414